MRRTTLYSTTMIDAPWMERGAGKIKRGADKHYKLMTREEILRTILQESPFNPADNSHLYLWATNNHLEDALWLMRALGFTYKTNVAWMKFKKGKVQIGIGQYFRGSHELLLFGTRGKAMLPEKALSSVLVQRREVHSQKPSKAYDLIESTSPGPYLELFARSRRKGWKVWGDEVPKRAAKVRP